MCFIFRGRGLDVHWKGEDTLRGLGLPLRRPGWLLVGSGAVLSGQYSFYGDLLVFGLPRFKLGNPRDGWPRAALSDRGVPRSRRRANLGLKLSQGMPLLSLGLRPQPCRYLAHGDNPSFNDRHPLRAAREGSDRIAGIWNR